MTLPTKYNWYARWHLVPFSFYRRLNLAENINIQIHASESIQDGKSRLTLFLDIALRKVIGRFFLLGLWLIVGSG